MSNVSDQLNQQQETPIELDFRAAPAPNRKTSFGVGLVTRQLPDQPLKPETESGSRLANASGESLLTTEPAEANPQSSPLKPYNPPQLKFHGRLAEITRFGGSLITDSGGGLGSLP